MLIVCPDCRRQYDVADLRAGEQVRCRCGKLVEVPRERVREARVVHCSSCGGKLRVGAATCDYCGSQILAADRNLGPVCPECFARLPLGARFCSGCGVEIRPEALSAVRAKATCPRCKGSMVARDLAEAQYTECTSCGGIWLDERNFQSVIEKKDLSALGTLTSSGRPAATADLEEVRYLPCPTCGQLMNRKNFAGCSGVIVDTCKGHGIWFDGAELEKVIAFVQAGGLDKARQNEIDQEKSELDRIRSAKVAATTGRPFPAAKTGMDWTSSVPDLILQFIRSLR